MRFTQWVVLACLMVGAFTAQAAPGVEFSIGTPKFTTGENRTIFTDMRIKHLGGEQALTRYWTGTRWVFNPNWVPLLLVRKDDPKLSADINKLTLAQIAQITEGEGLPDYILRRGEVYVLQQLAPGQVSYRHYYGDTITVSFADTPADNPAITGYVWESLQGMQMAYDADGRLQWLKDGNRSPLYFNYNSQGELHTVQDAQQQVLLSYSYQSIPLSEQRESDHSTYRVTQIKDYKNREVNYQYQSGTGRLQAVVDVLGHSWQQLYNDKHYTGFIDPEGRKTTLDIDLDGRLRRYVNSDGVGKTYSYDFDKSEQLFTLQVQDQAGKITRSDYDFSGLVVKRTENGQVTRQQLAATDSNGLAITAVGIADTTRKYRRIWVSGNRGVHFNWSDCLITTDFLTGEQTVSKNCRPTAPPVYVKTRKVKDERGQTLVYHYNAHRELVGIDYPDGTSLKRTFKNIPGYGRRKTREQQRNGTVTEYHYDDKGQLITLVEAVGSNVERTTSYTYTSLGLQESVNYQGHSGDLPATWQYEYDSYGNLTKATDPYQNTTLYSQYDALGNAQQITDANSHVWQQTYDAAGNLLSSTNPYGQGQHFSYDKAGFIKTSEQDSGASYQLTVNASGLPTQITDNQNHSRKLNYDLANRPTLMQDARGNIQQFTYDARGRITAFKDAEGNNTQYSYEGELLAKVAYPTYNELYEYDATGKLLKTQQTASNINILRKHGYDIPNKLETRTDANGHTATTLKDALGRISRYIDNNQGETQFYYDGRDNLTKVVDPEGRSTTYTYNLRNEQLTETKQLQLGSGEQQQYQYDATGNRTRHQNAKGEVTLYQYDQANRLVAVKTFSNNQAVDSHVADPQSQSPLSTLTYQYNAKGQYTGYSDSNSSETRSYNNRGELQSITTHFGSFSKTQHYSYTANGLVDTYTSAEGQQYRYSYNKNNQITHVTVVGKGVLQWGNYQWQQATTLTLPGGSQISYSYDGLMRTQQRSLKNPAQQNMVSASYSYDNESNITDIQKTFGAGSQTQNSAYQYSYDNLYRLTASQSPVEDVQYQYDGVGNRTQESDNQAASTNTASYNANNQLTNYGNASYRYDANGHTVERIDVHNGQVRKTQYVYDAKQRLIAVKMVKTNGSYTEAELQNKTAAQLQTLAQSLTTQTVATYAYNGYGQRIKKQTTAIAAQGQSTTYYLYSEQGLAAEYAVQGCTSAEGAGCAGAANAQGNVIVEYHYKPQSTWMTNPITQIRNGQLYMYQNDHLGTPQRVIRTNGLVVWQADYEAFGEADVEQGLANQIENNLRFPGQYYDVETGVHYNFYRDYDPSLGRYIQSDPIGLAGGMNTFGYVYQSPLFGSDPYGLFLCDALKLLGDTTIDLSAGVGMGIGASGGLSLSSSGVIGNVNVGVGIGLSGNASSGLTKSINVGSTGRSFNVQGNVSVGGGVGPAGAAVNVSAGTDGLTASGQIGIGIGASIVSGLGISGDILKCNDDNDNDNARGEQCHENSKSSLDRSNQFKNSTPNMSSPKRNTYINQDGTKSHSL